MIASAAVAGCYTGEDVSSTTMGSAAPASATSVDNTDPASMVGIPCDVAQVLAKDCASCHGTKPSGGAPNAMMTYDDLMAPSASAPSASIAEVSVARMKDAKSPMPPAGASAEDLAILDKWVAAGMPTSSATCDVSPAADVYDTPSVCTSGKHTTGGRSATMKPGEACNRCHDFTVAGTVYPTAHEPNDCNGSSSSAIKVVITGADGKTQTLPVNSTGNFYFNSSIKMPYKAKVISGTTVRAMATAQTDGDCNKCHTESGQQKDQTPGRVMAP